MIEIRPVRESELDGYLRLLCDTFDLDFVRAKPLFTGEPMFDMARNWGLFESGEIISSLTTRPLHFGWGDAIGIAGVATREDRRGEGFASKLMERVLREAERADEGAALLFAQDHSLYEKLGFEPIDRVVRAKIGYRDEPIPAEEPSFEEIRRRYDAWAERSPERLRRDEQRWDYWKWRYRETKRLDAGGYFTLENGYVREALGPDLERGLPVGSDVEAFGLTYMLDRLELPVEPISVELSLMGRNVPGLVQMFMTDQF